MMQDHTFELVSAEEQLVPDDAHLAEDGKPTLNVMVMGHLDSGKSTLVGHLLAKEGVFASDEVDKAKADATENEKASFGFAYLCDKEEEERTRGATEHTNLPPTLETKKYKVS